MFKIMIVDNEAAIRKGLVHCIRWDTLDCIVAGQAEDGIDALNQIPAIHPDIVISDIRMPGLDGLELAKQLREFFPSIKTIILTGFPDFEYAQKAIEYNVVDFVLKPTSVTALTQAIEKAKVLIAEDSNKFHIVRELTQQSEQNLQLQQGLLIHNLICGASLSHIYVLNRIGELNLNLTNYHVIRLEILATEEDNTDPQLCIQQAQSILSDCLSEYRVYFAPFGDQACYLIVCTSELDSLVIKCKEAVSVAASLPHFQLLIGISQHYTDPMRMSRAAEEAKQSAQMAQCSKKCSVIYHSQIPSIPQSIVAHLYDELKLLKSAIENQNIIGSQKIIQQLFQYMKDNLLPMEEVRNTCVYIHQFCINSIFFHDAEEYLSENGLPALKNLIDGTTIDILEKNMLDFTALILENMSFNTSNQGNPIHIVKTYIAQHYAEDLTLEKLSSLVYLSPTYLSKLFKRETGETLSTYVLNVRLDEAKTLFRSTPLKTYEIAERVGISDPVYFSRIFKKIVGVKPTDFRKSYRE